ncbi:hypothetical protein RBG61_13600 [Paludicola sp. MB14-C6]|uniref:DUF6591 domain-containing protein n=1 Tax=Paludihabitans sp. MB14-C6 TaxID=3070656 RepID=UPI0027DAC135|nr:DUF6591 domain-containing protein [Paludicola sp. MB14-C6]WMJ23004.1 hypothetical protein RBG61_13600 [Paludicola sp. MB14-C6]
MKKVVALFVLIAITMGMMVGCNNKQNGKEKQIEKAIEDVVSDKGKVDIDENKFSVKDEDGDEATFGQTTWPSGKAADLIPKCESGKVIGVVNSVDACVVTLEGVSEREYEAYVNVVKNAGYTTESGEINVASAKTYYGIKGQTTICVVYTVKGSYMAITLDSEK